MRAIELPQSRWDAAQEQRRRLPPAAASFPPAAEPAATRFVRTPSSRCLQAEPPVLAPPPVTMAALVRLAALALLVVALFAARCVRPCMQGGRVCLLAGWLAGWLAASALPAGFLCARRWALRG